MTDDERKLLLAIARLIAKREQDEADRLDMGTAYLNELRRLINSVADGSQDEPRRTEPQLLLTRRR